MSVELAQKRGLSKGTIVQHLTKIKEEDPEISLDRYKPEAVLFNRVKEIVSQLKAQNPQEIFTDDGKMRLKPIFEALGEEVGYDDIRICLLFLE